MWIFDSCYKGCVELWSRERGLADVSAAYPPFFYMHLKDFHAHWEMIEGLESRYKVEKCSFKQSSALSRDTGSTPAEKWPKRSRYKPAMLRSFTAWM